MARLTDLFGSFAVMTNPLGKVSSRVYRGGATTTSLVPGRIKAGEIVRTVPLSKTVSKLSLFQVGNLPSDFELVITGKTSTTTNTLVNYYLDYSTTSDTIVSTPTASATTTLYFATQGVVPFDVGSVVFVKSTTNNVIYTVTVTNCSTSSVSFATPTWTIPLSGLTVKSGATVYSQYSVAPTSNKTGLARDNLYWFNLNPFVRADRKATSRDVTNATFTTPATSGNLVKSIEVVRADKTIVRSGKASSVVKLKTVQLLSTVVTGKSSVVIRDAKTNILPSAITKLKTPSRLTGVFFTPAISKLSQFQAGNPLGDFELAITGKTSTTTNTLVNYYLDYSTTSDTIVSTPTVNATTTLYFATQGVVPFDVGSAALVKSTTNNVIYTVTVTNCSTSSVSFTTPTWTIPLSGLTVKSGATVYSQYSVAPTYVNTGLARDNLYWFNLNPFARADRTATSRDVTNATFTTPATSGNLVKSIEVVRADKTIVRSGKASSIVVLKSDKVSLRSNNLQKQIEVIKNPTPIITAFRSSNLQKQIEIVLGQKIITTVSSIQNPLKISYKTTQVFYTPTSSKLKTAAALKGERLISSFVVGKSNVVIRDARATVLAALVTRLKTPSTLTSVFNTPLQLSLPKQFEVVRADRTLVVSGKVKTATNLKADRTTLTSGSSKLGIVVRDARARILPSAIIKLKTPVNAFSVFFTPVISKLSQFPVSNSPGDFELAITGKTSTATNTLVNFYLDYSTTSDTIVSTPTASATTTLYFATQGVVPFDVGSSIFVKSATNNVIYTVTVISCSTSSVSFATPTWAIPLSGLTVKSGSTIYSQYAVAPTYVNTGLARDNLYWFNLNPFVRADRTATSRDVTNATFTTPSTQGNLSKRLVDIRDAKTNISVSQLQKQIAVIRDAKTTVRSGKVSSVVALKSDKVSLLSNNLQKQIAVVKDARTSRLTVSAIQTPLKISYKTTQVFYVPQVNKLTTAATLKDISTFKYFITPKLRAASALRGLPNASSVFDVIVVNKLKTPANNAQIFAIPNSNNLTKAIEAVKGLPNTSYVFDMPKLRAVSVLRGDKSVILSGRAAATAKLKNPTPNDSSVFDAEKVIKFTSNIRLAALYLGTDTTYKLSQFEPNATPGDFKFVVTGKNSTITNTLVNYYLDYSTSSDTLVSTPTASATTTFYFAKQGVVPFGVGSTIKITSTTENLIKYVTVTNCSTSSVSFATPTWPVANSGYIVESGSTIYSQYAVAPTYINTGLARDNLYWFNLNPFARADRTATSRNITNSTFTTSTQGNLAKPIEVIRDLVNNILTGRVVSTAVLKNDRVILRTNQIQKAIEIVRAETTLLRSSQLQKAIEVVRSDRATLNLSLVSKLKVPSANAQVFYSPLASKLKSIQVLRADTALLRSSQLQKAIEVVRSDRATLRLSLINKLKVPSANAQVFYSPTINKLSTSAVLRNVINDNVVFKLGKLTAGAVVRDVRTSIAAAIITKFKAPSANNQVFNTVTSYLLTKQLEKIRGDQTLLTTAKVKDSAVIRDAVVSLTTAKVKDSAVIRGVGVDLYKTLLREVPYKFPSRLSQVFSPGANTYKLAQFPAGSSKPDFKIAVLGQSADNANNLVSFYLDYSVTSDTVKTTPVSQATKTLYFATQQVVPFDLGAIVKITSTSENTAYFVTVTACTVSSVSFAQPTWSLSSNSLFVEDGATVYSQYSVAPTYVNTGLARDNLYWFNLNPFIRADRKATSRDVTNATFTTPTQGNLAKRLVDIRDAKTNISVSQLQKQFEKINGLPNTSFVFDTAKIKVSVVARDSRSKISADIIAKFKTPSTNTQVFHAPLTSKVTASTIIKADNAALLASQLQKQLEVIRADRSAVTSGKVTASAIIKDARTSRLTVSAIQTPLKISYRTTQVFYAPLASKVTANTVIKADNVTLRSSQLQKQLEVIRSDNPLFRLSRIETAFAQSNIRLTTAPTNARENLYYATLIPSKRQDRYQTRFNTFTLNPLPTTVNTPNVNTVEKQLFKLKDTLARLSFASLKRTSVIREAYPFTVKKLLGKDADRKIDVDTVQVLYFDNPLGNVKLSVSLTDMTGLKVVQPIDLYSAKLTSGLTTAPTNARENLYYATLVPSKRQDRYQTRFNTFTLNVLPVTFDTPTTAQVNRIKVPSNATGVFDTPVTSQLAKQIELIRSDRSTLNFSAIKNLKVSYTSTQVFVTPLQSSLSKQIELVRSVVDTSSVGRVATTRKLISTSQLLSALVKKVKVPSNRTLVFDTPVISQLAKQFQTVKSVPDTRSVGRVATTRKLIDASSRYTQTGKTLLRQFVREVPIPLDFATVRKLKLNKDTLQIFNNPDSGLINKLKSGTYGVGIADPAFKKREPIQFWN